MQQQNFQQERLLNQPTNNQRITNVRLAKQLQYLKQSNLKYQICQLSSLLASRQNSRVTNNNQNVSNEDKDSWIFSHEGVQLKDISHRIAIKQEKFLSKELALFIPKHYPFQEPLFYYFKQQNQQIIRERDNQISFSSRQTNHLQQEDQHQALLSFNQIHNQDKNTNQQKKLSTKTSSTKPKLSINTNTNNQIDQQISQYKNQLAHSQSISQLMIWLPKYKILQLVELIAIKISQKNKQETIMNRYFITKVFDKLNSPLIIFTVAILLRVLVGLGSYSGKNDWPNLGDFQAHRNWMSITVNRPISEWYLEYQPKQNIWWRIDYPPIAAYISYVFGSLYKHIQPQAMHLQRGYQSALLLTYMRLTVLLVEVFFLFPPIYFLAFKSDSLSQKYSVTKKFSLIFLFTVLIKPDIILIDHGHFQYNSLILGLILSAFYFLLNRNYYLCCIYFTIALHSKQMSFYYALAFFAGLIGKTISDYRTNKVKIIGELIKFGTIVVLVSLIIWLPFIISGSAHLVVQAIFPVHRGLYQLKVQNFWCISDVVMKWQNKFSNQILMLLCFLISTILSLPAIICMIFQANKKVLTIGFFTISMTFFMFSYHVHEKSILLPLLMAPFLGQFLGSSFSYNLILAGILGMYHLLKQDGQWLQYYVLMGFYIILMQSFNKISYNLRQFTAQKSHQICEIQKIHRKIWQLSQDQNDQATSNSKIQYLLYLILGVLHLSQIFITPPAKLEYLYHLLFAFSSFCLNSYSLVVCNCILVQTLYRKMNIKSSKET